MAKIEVISSCLVGTTRDIASTLELNAWDLIFLPRNYIQRGLIFHKPTQINGNFIDGLKTSLSRTLDLFPPLAGRLGTTAHGGDMSRFFVDCNNAGAEFCHAVAAAVSVSDILGAKDTPQIVSSLFLSKEVFNVDGVSTPLLAVQVTELADGVFVGISANHAVIDGTSFWHFVNSWSEISRGLDTISKPPVFKRWFPINARDEDRLIHVPSMEKNKALVAPSPTAPQRFFHFRKESVAKLKAKANSEANSDKISSLQAVVAHLWRSIIRCRWQSTEQQHLMIMAVGARGRVAALPEGFFGNAIYIAMVMIGARELLDKGLGHVALKINEAVSQQSEETVTHVLKKKVEFSEKHSGRRPLFIGSSPRTDVYGNDFGWGKPIGVRSGETQKFEGLVLAFPTTEAGGIDLEVCLPSEILEAIECDADFVEAFT